MSVIRIDEFRSAEGRHEELHRALAEILASVRGTDGSESVQIFQSESEPERFVVVERWRDQDAHQRAMSSIRPAALHRVMSFLSEMPAGAYYTEAT